MAPIIYSISFHGHGWAIALNGDHVDICRTLEVALTASIWAAKLGYRKGHDSQVILTERGSDHVLWRNRDLINEPGSEAIAA